MVKVAKIVDGKRTIVDMQDNIWAEIQKGCPLPKGVSYERAGNKETAKPVQEASEVSEAAEVTKPEKKQKNG